ncbi:MAG: arginine--tRNA ligase [Euryarchaeota archaeon]|nr:arginine--tRNA ligase [Euryarchaeota archaeon]MBT5255282.1 arginine--tRNA ligase [Euryarchaeota archaeon]
MKLLRDEVEELIGQALAKSGITGDNWRNMLAPSRDTSQGDLSLPCFPLAKQLSKNPIELAQTIADEISSHPAIGQVLAVGGYLNIKADMNWLAQQVLSGKVRVGDPFGSLSSTGRKVLIEHTSANPNGPFHVGRARNAILGDSLVRLHRLFGNEVRAEYYVDDMGKQVAVLAWALANLSEQQVEETLVGRDGVNPRWSGKADHETVRWYQAAQKIRGEEDAQAIEEEIGRLVHASEHGDQEVLQQFEAAYQPVLDGMLTTLSRLGIDFDTFTKESEFVINGDVAKLMQRLSEMEIYGEADNGAGYLDLGQRGLKGKTEFFFRRGDGSSLYATRDIAYHMWKWQQSDELINVLGEDHKLQGKQVGMTLQELGQKVPEIMFYSFIKLPEGKMSTRKGNVVFMDDLLEEAQAQAASVVRELRPDYQEQQVLEIAEAVGVSAVRFNIVKVSPDKGFTFRWEEALAFEAGSAPFIMYSHTRAHSVMKRCIEAGADIDSILAEEIDYSNQEMPNGLVELLRTIARHNDVLGKAVNLRKPHLFATQLLDLANAYNGFYRDCHILVEGVPNPFYLQVSETARNLLRTGMQGIGIIPLEQM